LEVQNAAVLLPAVGENPPCLFRIGFHRSTSSRMIGPGNQGTVHVPGENPGRITGGYMGCSSPHSVCLFPLVPIDERCSFSWAVGINPIGPLKLIAELSRDVYVAGKLPSALRGAAMSVSTATPGAVSSLIAAAPGFPWVFPQRSNQTISEAFRRPQFNPGGGYTRLCGGKAGQWVGLRRESGGWSV